MDRIKLNSSSISEVGFDPASNTLEVVFADGRLYQYFEVPQHVYQGLIAAAACAGRIARASSDQGDKAR